ncbi:helix-turn-helix domain-containing protein [Rhodococcus erythropolis]|uniref:helix-turn-helix domain-containing protein n=1 Tax=Rhodococcus erythropolis TaxID=1833 RepID=UPI001BE8B059|nr:helix-turn-helix transcriptional regulator [Rhodococcus erythropolis]MBT2266393.1 helix-turn-helix transcriptional regulator [Rhodococcus erythropolis]
MDINKLNAAIGAQLRGARATADYSRERLAELAGLSPKTIQRIENGERPADIAQLGALCEALEQDLTGLVKRAVEASK